MIIRLTLTYCLTHFSCTSTLIVLDLQTSGGVPRTRILVGHGQDKAGAGQGIRVNFFVES